jgi:hypothetical protein
MSITAVSIRSDNTELFRYVYQPDDPVLESPRPYLHPVYTLDGDLVSIFRPHDHVWHKGISLAFPNVGPHNFWGGPTYRHDDGYIQLPNNGTTRHDDFELANDGLLAERLTWLTQDGKPIAEENRSITVSAWPADNAWRLSFETTVRNVLPEELRFGSPTTEGRENAGYGGLFWRGPRSFTGGTAITPGATGGDELMGTRAPWLAFTGQHDGHTRWSTLIFTDDPEIPGQWFVRSTPFAGVCPAPFFATQYMLGSGETWTRRYGVIVCCGQRDTAGCAELAGRA